MLLNIHRDIDQHRSRTPRRGNIKRFLEHTRQIGRFGHQITVLGERLCRTGDIRLLKHVTADQIASDLTRDDDQRDRIHIRRSNTCQQIGSARPRSRNTNIKCETDFERFCLCTGLRRREITALRGSALIEENRQYYIAVNNGKGGRKRISEIIGTPEEIEFVINIMQKAGKNKVFCEIPSCDIHAYRAAYAKKVYQKYARERNDYKNERMILYHNRLVATYTDRNEVSKYYNPDGTLKKGFKDVRTAYCCRDDKKHIVYDRIALLKCSQALGHNRASVVADHYLWI